MTFFDRQYRLTIQGDQIGAPEAPYFIPLHISFSIEKTDLETQNTARMTIWNLNERHIAMLKSNNCYVSLRAGYGNMMPLIFAGTVSSCKTSEDGSDWKTEIEVIDNLREVQDTYVKLSFSGTVCWKSIINSAADQMGITVDYSYNASCTDVTDYSYIGPVSTVLSKACKCSGLSWSIQNGVLQVKKIGDCMNLSVFVLSQDTGLVGSPVEVTVSDDEDKNTTEHGWDVEYLMNAAIQVSDYVMLKAKHVTGLFTVYSVQIEGDNLSGSWTCKARLMEVKS